jgi:hypothetical protein
VKYTEAPQIRVGAHPKSARPFMSHSLGVQLFARIVVVPGKAHEAQWTIERKGRRFQIRIWWRGIEVPAWYSPGYHDVSLARMALIWIRAAFNRRERIPKARTIERSKMARMFGEE